MNSVITSTNHFAFSFVPGPPKEFSTAICRAGHCESTQETALLKRGRWDMVRSSPTRLVRVTAKGRVHSICKGIHNRVVRLPFHSYGRRSYNKFSHNQWKKLIVHKMFSGTINNCQGACGVTGSWAKLIVFELCWPVYSVA